MTRRILYIDCFSGVSGDMLLGAFFNLGVSFSEWLSEMQKLNLHPAPEITVKEVLRKGIKASLVYISEPIENKNPVFHNHERPFVHEHNHLDSHEHSNSHSRGRKLADMRALLSESRLDDSTKDKTLLALNRLAETEAGVHGASPEEVHFHELSGIDTIIDIAGAFTAARLLGLDEIICSPINVGAGIIKMSHGEVSVPAPATAALLKGIPVYSRFNGELTTPTGALLATALADSFGSMPAMRLLSTGFGAGGRDLPHPNVLRLFLGETQEDETANDAITETGRLSYRMEEIYQLSANIDDMDPRAAGRLIGLMLEKGALDAYIEPVIMKKNRPGIVFNTLCETNFLDEAISVFMRETPTLGVRILPVKRAVLDREMKTLDTQYGKINIKIALWKGEPLKAIVEYEDCARASANTGIALTEILMNVSKRAADEFLKK